MMTPMIDVVFLLLVFFVCTAGGDRPEQALPTQLDVPGMGDAVAERPPDDLEDIIVRLNEVAGRTVYSVNDRVCADVAEVGQVLASLAEIDTQLAVTLDVAPEVPLGLMIDVYDACRGRGFSRVQFAAD